MYGKLRTSTSGGIGGALIARSPHGAAEPIAGTEIDAARLELSHIFR